MAEAGGALDWYRRHRYTVLFFTLLATLAIAPLRDLLGLNARLLELFVALNLVVAASGISARPRRQRLLIGLSTVVVGTRFLPPGLLEGRVGEVVDLVWIVIAALAALGAVRFALRATVVDREHVSAALSAYLLTGLIFAVLYVLVDRVWPGAIADGGAPPGHGPLPLETAIYFSYVTLATLGYGDVVPRAGAARGLAIVEALGAQLYLTVTVARLVGLHAHGASQRDNDRKEGPS